MIYEVAAAVDHIISLVQQVQRDQPIASDALAAFSSTLKDALEKRCQQCWKPAEPECGSARRSVAWQLHSAGEGADLDLLRAFASVVQAQAEEGEIVRPHQHTVLTLAMEWLPMAFTLWIDPGCVAVRMGSGPGVSRSYDFDLINKSTSSSIHVVWGQMVAATTESDLPQLTVSSAPRPIPIVKPTPTVAQPRYPVNLSNARHSRSPSTASSASSGCGLIRSVSLSSTHTVSTDATSLTDAEESCPSLCSPFSSLDCTPSTDNEHDVTVGDTTERFAGVRLFNDDDEEEAGDETIGAVLSKPAASTPVKCNYTTHDNGNVGVLGGGVRLGGAVKSAPRHRQHSTSKSISHIQGMHNQLLPAYMPRPAPHLHMSAANYSAPLRSVPLPPAPMQQPYQQFTYQHQQYPVQAMQYARQPHLPPPHAQQHYPLPPLPPADDEEGQRRRTRSRGRRSRGRGAGRAARRQAAALKAASDDEGESRCSTPFTDSSSAVSSVYSSATSSPVKQGLSKRGSRKDLRAEMEKEWQGQMAFGRRLTAGLARLIA